MADLHGKILEADPHPSLGPIFFIFMHFSETFVQIIGWHGLVPPLGNTGFAAGCRCTPRMWLRLETYPTDNTTPSMLTRQYLLSEVAAR